MTLLKITFILCIWCNAVFIRFQVQKTFSTYCSLLLLLYARLSQTRRFLKSSSFWEVRSPLIGHLSSALWLDEYIKCYAPHRIVMTCPGATTYLQILVHIAIWFKCNNLLLINSSKIWQIYWHSALNCNLRFLWLDSEIPSAFSASRKS